MKDIESERQKACQQRIHELERERRELEKANGQPSTLLRQDLNDFNARMKTLYTSIFQGSKELSIRKNDLIRQIRGNDSDEQY